MRLTYGWLLAAVGLLAGACMGQTTPAPASIEGLSIASIETAGNVTLTRAAILAVVSLRSGQRFSASEADGDVRRIGKLDAVQRAYYNTQIVDGKVKLTYVVEEKNLVRTLALSGNKKMSDARLTKELGFKLGDYLDPVAVRAGRDAIEALYRKKGYAMVHITHDEAQMAVGKVKYVIEEGPRPKIKAVRFTGNSAFKPRELKKPIKTKTKKFFIIQGYYDAEQVNEDVKKLIEVYQKSAFLDVKVKSEVVFGQDNKNAVVTYHIEEGPVYLVDSIRFSGYSFFDEMTLRQEMKLREEFFYSHDRAEFDSKKIQSKYLKEGFIEAKVELKRTFLPAAPRVAVEFIITEGQRYRLGEVVIMGNTTIQDRAIRRVLDEEGFEPGAWYDADAARGTGEGELEKIVKQTVITESAIITPTGTEPDFRDAMVKIKEGQTGSIMLGAGVASDSGVIGNITLDQRNFDITDTPESFSELFTGQAFRGAGQRFRISLSPGTEYSSYGAYFTEPYLYDKPVSLNVGGSSFDRYRESWDEGRLTGSLGLEKRYRDDWRRGVSFRGEQVTISDLDPDVPKEISDVKGGNMLYGTRFYVRRDKTDSRFTPSKGYHFDAGYEQVFGDFTFGMLTATQRWYNTLYEDLSERKTVLETKLYGGTVIGDAPMFEKFYGGGQSSIRGFDYRGISPRKGPDEDPIGSDWIAIFSNEISIPLGSDVFAWLLFTDIGMIDSGPVRSSIGTGIQIMIPQFFGPVPMRFELATPITKDSQDDTRVFSFSAGVLF